MTPHEGGKGKVGHKGVTEGGGVKNCPKLCDVINEWPLWVSVVVKRRAE